MSTKFAVVSALVLTAVVGLMQEKPFRERKPVKPMPARIKSPESIPNPKTVIIDLVEQMDPEAADYQVSELLSDLCTLHVRLAGVTASDDRKILIWDAIKQAREFKEITEENFDKNKHCGRSV